MSQKYTIKQVVRILRKYEEFITLRCEAEKSLTYLFAQGNGQNYDERLRKIASKIPIEIRNEMGLKKVEIQGVEISLEDKILESSETIR